MPARNRTRELARTHTPCTARPIERATLPTLLEDTADLSRLVNLLLDPGRSHPVAVVSIHRGEPLPWIDAHQVADALAGMVPVYVIPNDLAWGLAAALPPMTQVYGGAGRVYPIGQAWTDDPYHSPLRLVYGLQDGSRATDLLISDGLGMARRPRPAIASSLRQVGVAGVVAALAGTTRAIVRLEDGSMATIWPELAAAGVPAERLLTPGQHVHGLLNLDTRRLDVAGSLVRPADALAAYRAGDVVLAQVRNVNAHAVQLAVHPHVATWVPRADVTSNERDVLDELFTVGETVLARVRQLLDADVRLGLDDIDDDDTPVPAPALLPGGPAWLTAPAQLAEMPVATPEQPTPAPAAFAAPAQDAPVVDVLAAPVAPAPAVSPAPALVVPVESAPPAPAAAAVSDVQASTAVANLTAQVTGLEQQVRWLSTERQRLLEQVTAQKQHLLRKVQAAGKATRRQECATPGDEAFPVAFEDPYDQFRFEVELEWATRIAPAQKRELPLAPWTIGPEFLASVASLQGLSRRTLIRVVVEVLTGLAEQMPGRDLHRLRNGAGPGAPVVQRADGAVCWRVALQQSAAARRLHYWKVGDRIELSRVGVHDDMRA
jgi:hypothetical protein